MAFAAEAQQAEEQAGLGSAVLFRIALRGTCLRRTQRLALSRWRLAWRHKGSFARDLPERSAPPARLQ